MKRKGENLTVHTNDRGGMRSKSSFKTTLSHTMEPKEDDDDKTSHALMKVTAFHIVFSIILTSGTIAYVLLFSYHVFFACPLNGVGCLWKGGRGVDTNLNTSNAEDASHEDFECTGSRRCCDYAGELVRFARDIAGYAERPESMTAGPTSDPQLNFAFDPTTLRELIMLDRLEGFLLAAAGVQAFSVMMVIIFMTHRRHLMASIESHTKHIQRACASHEEMTKDMMSRNLLYLAHQTEAQDNKCISSSSEHGSTDDVGERVSEGVTRSEYTTTDESPGRDKHRPDTAHWEKDRERLDNQIMRRKARRKSNRALLSGIQTLGIIIITLLDCAAIGLFCMVFLEDVIEANCIGLYLLSGVWFFQAFQRTYTLPSTILFITCHTKGRRGCASICEVFLNCTQALLFKLCSSLAIFVALAVGGMIVYFKYFAQPVMQLIEIID